MKKALIIGAGPLLDSSFLKEKKDYFLVACDGGYQHYLNEKIEPDLFVGDFDTFDKSKIKKPKELIPLNVMKDDTDVFYSIKYLLDKGYNYFELYGCLGGKIEHTFANIQLLSYLVNHHAKGYLYSANNQTIVHMISNSCIRLKPLESGFLSVFSYNCKSQGVCIENLLYTLNNATLSNDVPLGISNQFIGKEATISVRDGTLLLVLPKDSLYE